MSRAAVSFAYSLSLLSLTAAVLFGHHLYKKLSPPLIFLLVAFGSAIGLLLSAGSSTIFSVYLFYGCLFGFANGLGYGYALQLAGQIVEKNHAVSMSLVTAFYAVGAVCASPGFKVLVDSGGNTLALKVTGIILFLVCVLAAACIAVLRISFATEPLNNITTITSDDKKLRLLLWISYGTAVSAGLMVISHAYPLLSAKYPGTGNAEISPMLVAVGNIAGGISIGVLSMHVRHKILLIVLSCLSLVGLLLVLINSTFNVTLLGLILIGFGYGAIIALYPVVVSSVFGKLSSARIYGQIFTAWGLAGLVAPTISGLIYDHLGNYSVSLLVAILLSAISVFTISKTAIN